MIDAPERIWAWDETGETCELMGHKEGEWTTEDCSDTAISATEYVHADLHDATERKLAKAVEALRFYREQFCEGFCGDCPSTFTSPEMELDCSCCKARAVLAEIEKGVMDTSKIIVALLLAPTIICLWAFAGVAVLKIIGSCYP